MKRILLTGMSGTGKSSVISELAARGYKAIDADSDEWSAWAPYVAIPDLPEANEPELEWVWRADRIRDLLVTDDADLLFVSGCASNMSQFYGQFDHIVLLSAPTAVIFTGGINERNTRPIPIAFRRGKSYFPLSLSA